MIVFDAAGTLVVPARPVGALYAAILRPLGADLDPVAIERGFAAALRAAPPLAFGDRPAPERRAAERAWWRDVARAAVGAANPPADLAIEPFLDRAWDAFAAPAAWRVPDDVRPALRALRRAGVPLAVLSNWDARLSPLLDALGLGGFFARVLVSGDLPAAKPDAAAYAAAAAALGPLAAEPPLMVGDRLEHDVLPALAAGWSAAWLDRSGRGEAPAGVRRIDDLGALAGAAARAA